MRIRVMPLEYTVAPEPASRRRSKRYEQSTVSARENRIETVADVSATRPAFGCTPAAGVMFGASPTKSDADPRMRDDIAVDKLAPVRLAPVTNAANRPGTSRGRSVWRPAV